MSHHRIQYNSLWRIMWILERIIETRGGENCVSLSNTSIIRGLHVNILNVIQYIQKGFQLTSEDETVHYDNKMANKSGKGFLLTTNFYKIANDAAHSPQKKWVLEEKADVQP